jgi:hypothetical protein
LEPIYAKMRSGNFPLGQPSGGQNPPPPAQDEDFFHTPASAMLGFQDYMCKTYGGVTEFLLDAGLSEEVIHRLREKFVEY